MTEQEIARIGPEFSAYLGRYRECFLQERTVAHFDNYCRGLLSNVGRKSVEPMALVSGTAVRTLQVFLANGKWDHARARDLFQQGVVAELAALPADRLGRIGIVDETAHVKKGNKTPGVQRQWCGALGKTENCIVTVHTAVVQGAYKTLLDADLFLPEGWDADRQRRQEAGIPDAVHYRPKWEIALEQQARLERNGLRFEWLTFDEGYGARVPYLRVLNAAQQRFVAEVPVSFAVRRRPGAKSCPANERLPATRTSRWQRFRLLRQTVGPQVWRARERRVWAAGRTLRLIAALNEATGEVKYFVTNALKSSLRRVLRVAFTRWNVEHVFRVAKQETGLTHYEGRQYQGLLRHLILGLIVMGFVSQQLLRLREKKSAHHIGANLPGSEPPLCLTPAPPPENPGNHLRQPGDPVPSAA